MKVCLNTAIFTLSFYFGPRLPVGIFPFAVVSRFPYKDPRARTIMSGASELFTYSVYLNFMKYLRIYWS